MGYFNSMYPFAKNDVSTCSGESLMNWSVKSSGGILVERMMMVAMLQLYERYYSSSAFL